MGSSAWYPSLGYHHNHHLANHHNHHTNNTHRRPNFLPVSAAGGPLSLRATVRRGWVRGDGDGLGGGGDAEVAGLGKEGSSPLLGQEGAQGKLGGDRMPDRIAGLKQGSLLV